MTATIIDGRALAAQAKEAIAARAAACAQDGLVPRLDAVLAGSEDTPARVYAQHQAKTCAAVGIDYTLHELHGECSQSDAIDLIQRLNEDGGVHAIMVHLPLPEGVSTEAVQSRIRARKDVEGVTPTNIGNVLYGRSELAPCTAAAALRLIDSTGIKLEGARCVIVGAGPVVGRPIAALLMQREATVISCNRFTKGLEELARSADVLIAAAGVPGLITGEMVKPGALVVDVGVSRVEGPGGGTVTVGDVAFDAVSPIAGQITPVPGGVGPMTVAVLLSNVVDAAQRALARG
ncbi:MAG: methylenetetrahydrofolate dehydrogenase (NADP+)/methenyltetrahydrofolate cyclohydrolase [Phycisphaerales bacterium]|jgi:methylenetetrahydrofolate dehydrogenase (NADP+)/methenyltetrahydrofolate cyclohydrolase